MPGVAGRSRARFIHRAMKILLRAAIIAVPEKFNVEDVPLAEPEPGRVRVHHEGRGVRGSKLAQEKEVFAV
jgi:hypothetical protein